MILWCIVACWCLNWCYAYASCESCLHQLFHWCFTITGSITRVAVSWLVLSNHIHTDKQHGRYNHTLLSLLCWSPYHTTFNCTTTCLNINVMYRWNMERPVIDLTLYEILTDVIQIPDLFFVKPTEFTLAEILVAWLLQLALSWILARLSY